MTLRAKMDHAYRLYLRCPMGRDRFWRARYLYYRALWMKEDVA